MEIFPTSPIWANVDRGLEQAWGEDVARYDTGLRQSIVVRQQPLNTYAIPIKNMGIDKQAPLYSFWKDHKAGGTPFLFKDPYDYTVESWTLATSTNMEAGSGFYATQENAYFVIPDSAFLAISDPASGDLVAGSHYVASQDNGFITCQVTVSSVWVSSFQYFRKCAIQSYRETSMLWQQFSGNIVIEELLPHDG